MFSSSERQLQADVAAEAKLDAISRSQNRTEKEDKEVRESFALTNGEHPAVAADAEDAIVPTGKVSRDGLYQLVHHSALEDEEHETALESKAVVGSTEYYLENNLINLNNSEAILAAAKNYNNLPENQKRQLMDYCKLLVNTSKSTKNSTPLSNFLSYVDPHNKKKDALIPWNAFSKDFKEELTNYYIQTYKLEYYMYCFQGIGGYASEFLYLAWDQIARIRMTRKMTGMPDAYNYAINYTVLPFVAQSQLTYNPIGEANDYMVNKMVYQKSITNVILAHKLKTLAFMLYAFGGGYVEVVDINDDLEEGLGAGKWPVIVLILYFAIVYYAMMQFMDMIKKFDEYSDQPSLLKRALNPFNGEKVSDRVTDLFNAQHEFICFIERIFRMSYGGFEAGGYALAGAVGLGTAPVSYAIRTMPLRDIYDLKQFKKPVEILETDSPDEIEAKELQSTKLIDNAIIEYNTQYSKHPVLGEIKLFVTPTILWLAPAAFFAAQYGTTGIENPYHKAVTGSLYALASTVVLHAGLGLRYPAKRRTIVSIAAEESAKSNVDRVVPNRLANYIAKPSNFCDQASRSITFVYGLGIMAPSLFDLNTKLGQDMFWSVLAESAFISLSAYIYQADKNARALASMSPRFFAKKTSGTQERLRTPLLGNDNQRDDDLIDHQDTTIDMERGRASSGSGSDILIGTHPAANDHNDEQQEAPRSRCAIM